MKRNKKIYISGPITGVPGAISAAHFARAEQDLRELGFCNIINPRFMFEGTGLPRGSDGARRGLCAQAAGL